MNDKVYNTPTEVISDLFVNNLMSNPHGETLDDTLSGSLLPKMSTLNF